MTVASCTRSLAYVTALPALNPDSFADLVDVLPVPAVVCASDGRIVQLSRALATLLDRYAPGGNWHGRTFNDLPLVRSLNGDAAGETYVLNEGGKPGRHYRKSSAMIGGDGQAALAVHFLTPQSSEPMDGLHPLGALGGRPQGLDRESGLQDRNAISHVLHAEVARCRRYGNPLSVIMICLTDACGEGLDTPDSLSAPAILGQLLAEHTRWADSSGRWSKERFLLILPETTLTAADYLINKIQQAAVGLKPAGIKLTLALSASQWSRSDDARSLLARAESGLEAAEVAT